MIYYLAYSDIQSTAFELAIANEISKANNFIYLTATQNLKNMRADSPCLSDRLIPIKKDTSHANLYSITEYLRLMAQKTYESKEYLSNADQKYLLSKVILHYYKNNLVKQKVMYEMRYDIYELFKLLLFHGKELNSEQIESIKSDYSSVESDLFAIYSLFQATITKMIAFISCGTNDELLIEILGDNFLKSTKQKPIKSFTDKQKELITEEIKSIDALFFDGFLFFDEMQRFILTTAVSQDKSLYFISKQFTDNSGAFLFEKTIKEIADRLGTEIQTIDLPYEKKSTGTALSYIKSTFPISVSKPPKNAKKLIKDGSVKFMRPFISREEELRYVVKTISYLLKTAYTGDVNEIVRMACNDVAIVLAIDKDNFEERISNLFREVGLFVFDSDRCENSSFSDVDAATFEPVYFERQMFLDANVKRESGESLSYQDKHIMFERLFMRIDINRSSRPIASYPIGQFVLELYRIISEGMSIEGFKGILYSNWRYNIDKVQLKWSDLSAISSILRCFSRVRKPLRIGQTRQHSLQY